MNDRPTYYQTNPNLSPDTVAMMIERKMLVPVEPCESFSPQSVHHCHYPKGHDGAHEAYRAYGYGVFHTVSWAHTFSAGAGIGGERYQSTPENDTPGIGGDDER